MKKTSIWLMTFLIALLAIIWNISPHINNFLLRKKFHVYNEGVVLVTGKFDLVVNSSFKALLTLSNGFYTNLRSSSRMIKETSLASPFTLLDSAWLIVFCGDIGCSSGIGNEIALELAKNNYTVFAGVRTPEAAWNISKNHPKIMPVHLDVTKEGTINAAHRAVMDYMRKSGLPFVGVVNNAGRYLWMHGWMDDFIDGR